MSTSKSNEDARVAGSSYVLDGGEAGRDRLRLLASAMQPLTESFLDRLSITSEMHCLDAGCGGGDVTRLIAARCNTVTGIDADATVVAIAQQELSDLNTASNINYVVGDITTHVPKVKYDVVYARFLMSHLVDAAKAMQQLLHLLRPGGTLAIEDVWFPGHFCYPQNAAFDRFVAWYRQCAHLRGAEPDIGLMLPEMFENIGLTDVSHEMHTQAFGAGARKRVSLVTLERISSAIRDARVATSSEIDAAIADLSAFVERDDTVISMAPVMQISGRVA